MKKSLDHLPGYKRRELREVTGIIVETASPAMVILFGSHARGTWVEDRFTDPEDHITYEYKSDFDLCVITEKRVQARSVNLWCKIDRLIRGSGVKTPFTIIAHDIKEFNGKIEKREYFFCDIKKEGILLYDSKKYALAPMKRLSQRERKKGAQEYFDQWFESASQFYEVFHVTMGKKFFKVAAFQLHQATERYFTTLLLVFTHYKPRTHDIELLDHQVSTFDPRLCTVFPRSTEEEKRLFTLLKKAYVDARYKKSYAITAEELVYLSGRVEKLRALTEEICRKKIAAMGKRSIAKKS